MEKKPYGYWKKWDNVEKELRKIIKKNKGKFPTQAILKEMNLLSLGAAIYSYHGSFNTVRKKIGYEIIKNPNGYYKDWRVFERDMKKAIEENNGEFHSNKRLREIGRGDLIKGIYHQGGFPVVRIKMGYELIERPKKHWKNWKNIEKEIKKAIKQNNGEFPSQNRLKELGYAYLCSAMTKNYGGINKIRKRLGFKTIGFSDKGKYADWDIFKIDMQKAIDKNNGEFPSTRRLEELGYGYLKNHAHDYHGGFRAIKGKIGYNKQMQIKLTKGLEEIAKELVA